MKIKNLAVVSVWGEDVPALMNFYGHTLDLPMLPHHGTRPHFKAGGAIVTILKGKPSIDWQAARFPLWAFEVEDLDVTVEELQQQKIQLPWGIEQDATSRWVMLYDPAGNLIELAEFSK